MITAVGVAEAEATQARHGVCNRLQWEERHAASRAREIAEKERAEVERLKKEEEQNKKVVAE